jgi:hypothetical protein
MTYNDLLEAVKSPTFMNSRTLETPYIALRAVLELHKPFNFMLGDKTLTSCQDCEKEAPCPTIQAIEKELS